MFKKLGFIFVVAIFLLSGCKDFKEVQCTGVKGFKVNKINTEGIDADSLLSIKNPNTTGFSIYRSEFEVMFNGIHLGKAKLARRVHISRNAEETYAFNLVSDFKNANVIDIMKLVNGITSRGMIEVKGDLKAGKLFIRKKFPVNVKQKLDL